MSVKYGIHLNSEGVAIDDLNRPFVPDNQEVPDPNYASPEAQIWASDAKDSIDKISRYPGAATLMKGTDASDTSSNSEFFQKFANEYANLNKSVDAVNQLIGTIPDQNSLASLPYFLRNLKRNWDDFNKSADSRASFYSDLADEHAARGNSADALRNNFKAGFARSSFLRPLAFLFGHPVTLHTDFDKSDNEDDHILGARPTYSYVDSSYSPQGVFSPWLSLLTNAGSEASVASYLWDTSIDALNDGVARFVSSWNPASDNPIAPSSSDVARFLGSYGEGRIPAHVLRELEYASHYGITPEGDINHSYPTDAAFGFSRFLPYRDREAWASLGVDPDSSTAAIGAALAGPAHKFLDFVAFPTRTGDSMALAPAGRVAHAISGAIVGSAANHAIAGASQAAGPAVRAGRAVIRSSPAEGFTSSDVVPVVRKANQAVLDSLGKDVSKVHPDSLFNISDPTFLKDASGQLYGPFYGIVDASAPDITSQLAWNRFGMPGNLLTRPNLGLNPRLARWVHDVLFCFGGLPLMGAIQSLGVSLTNKLLSESGESPVETATNINPLRSGSDEDQANPFVEYLDSVEEGLGPSRRAPSGWNVKELYKGKLPHQYDNVDESSASGPLSKLVNPRIKHPTEPE